MGVIVSKRNMRLFINFIVFHEFVLRKEDKSRHMYNSNNRKVLPFHLMRGREAEKGMTWHIWRWYVRTAAAARFLSVFSVKF